MKRLIKADYNVYKDLEKITKNTILNGDEKIVNDGKGNEYIVPKNGCSGIVKSEETGACFVYDYGKSLLKYIDEATNEEIDATGLSVYNWVESPEYWIDQYEYELQETIKYLNLENEFF